MHKRKSPRLAQLGEKNYSEGVWYGDQESEDEEFVPVFQVALEACQKRRKIVVADSSKQPARVLFNERIQALGKALARLLQSLESGSRGTRELIWRHCEQSIIEKTWQNLRSDIRVFVRDPSHHAWTQDSSRMLFEQEALIKQARRALRMAMSRFSRKHCKTRVPMRFGTPVKRVLRQLDDRFRKYFGYDRHGQPIYVSLHRIDSESLPRELEAQASSLPSFIKRVPVAYAFLASRTSIGLCYVLPRGKFYTDYACQIESRALCQAGVFFKRYTVSDSRVAEGLLVDYSGTLHYVPVYCEQPEGVRERAIRNPLKRSRVEIDLCSEELRIFSYEYEREPCWVEAKHLMRDVLQYAKEFTSDDISRLAPASFAYIDAPESHGPGVTFSILSAFFEQVFFEHNLFRVAENGIVMIALAKTQQSPCTTCQKHSRQSVCVLLKPSNLKALGRLLFQVFLRNLDQDPAHHYKLPYRLSVLLAQAIESHGHIRDVEIGEAWRELQDAFPNNALVEKLVQIERWRHEQPEGITDEYGFLYGLDWSAVSTEAGAVSLDTFENFLAASVRYALVESMLFPHECALNLSRGFHYHSRASHILALHAKQGILDFVCSPAAPLEISERERSAFVNSIRFYSECPEGAQIRTTILERLATFGTREIRALCMYAGGVSTPSMRPDLAISFRLVSCASEETLHVSTCANQITLPCHADALRVFFDSLANVADEMFNAI